VATISNSVRAASAMVPGDFTSAFALEATDR
jgi:hypothetical protein